MKTITLWFCFLLAHTQTASNLHYIDYSVRSLHRKPPTAIYINEMLVDPDDVSDNPNEYIEIRGIPDQSLDDVYLIFLESDFPATGNRLGAIQGAGNTNIVDLSGYKLGTNGFLVILDDAEDPYSVAAGTTVVDIPGFDVENASFTASLIHVDATGSEPVENQDLDSDDDGLDPLPEGWTLLDGVGVLDNGGSDRAYADIVFSGNGNGLVAVGANLIDTGFGADDIIHVMRVGNSTGSLETDWVAFELGVASSPPDFIIELSTNDNYETGANITNHLGEINPISTATNHDSVPPAIDCPADIMVDSNSGNSGAVVTFIVSAIDDHPGEVIIVTDYLSGTLFPVGTTMVTAIATDVAGNSSECFFNITVNELTLTGLQIQEFVLVNADTDTDIIVISEGDIIDFSTLPTNNLNIRAETTTDTESVFLDLSGAQSNSRTENVAPYALYGDNSGEFVPHLFAIGSYSLQATAYSQDGLRGNAGYSAVVNFSFVNTGMESPLILVDSSNDTEIMALTDDAIIDKGILGDLLFGIVYDPDLDPKGVKFSLSGPINENRTEGSFPPYSLFGDLGMNIQGMIFPDGDYSLVVNPNSGLAVRLNFQVVGGDPLPTPMITDFVLVDSDSDSDILSLSEGQVVNQEILSTINLNIRANANSDTESVLMELNGAATKERKENKVPYALFGDIAGDYLPGAFPAGAYTLTATPYAGNDLSGTMGMPMTINFTVTDGEGGMLALKLYPNPAVTEIEVEMVDTEKKMEIYSIQVRDMQGRLIRSYDSKQVSGSDHFKMPTHSLQSGVYYMTVMGSKGTVQKKTFVVNN